MEYRTHRLFGMGRQLNELAALGWRVVPGIVALNDGYNYILLEREVQ